MQIYENSIAGTPVVDVNATDQDAGEFGEVRYQLEDDLNAFTIDPLTVVNYTLVHNHTLLLTASI